MAAGKSPSASRTVCCHAYDESMDAPDAVGGEAGMSDEARSLTRDQLDEFKVLLVDVEQATSLRPPDQQDGYTRAQDSVVEARRVAEVRAASLNIVS